MTAIDHVEVLGQQVALPVEVRAARAAAATYLVDLTIDDRRAHCRLAHDGELVLELTISNRVVPFPSKPMEMSAYAHLDGVTRRTPFTSRATGVRGGPFGARLALGDRHPMARELRGLGLPKRAVMSSVIGNMAASFGPASAL